MKKILFLNTVARGGGAAQMAESLFKGCTNETDKYKAFFAYGRGPVVKERGYFYFGNKLEVFFHLFLVRFFGIEGYGTYFATRKLINFIKKEKFELVHLHNLHGYYLNFFKLLNFLQEEKIPVIWSLHDEWATTWLPAYTNFDEEPAGYKNWLNRKNVYPKNYFPIFKNFMSKKKTKVFTSNWEPLFICPSEWLKEKIKASYLKNYTIAVINHGVDTEIFKPLQNKKELRIKHNLPIDKKIILFVAANFNDKRKGISDIIATAKTLNTDNYFFVGIGSGKVEAINNLKIFNYVRNKNELAEFYNLSDLFCFASTAETFLLTVAESLSCETPVVGYKIPVVSEIFKNEGGILVNLNDKNSLAQAISLLLSDDELRIKMGSQGRKLIRENYSQTLFYKKYFELYNK